MNQPVRVLQVTGIMDMGGAETLIMNIYRHIDRSRIQFDFVANSEIKGYFDDEILALGGRIYYCPHYNGKNHFIYKKWWKDFFSKHSKEYQIVHGHIGSTASIYLSIAKRYGLYTIAHSHNMHGKSLKSFMYRIYSYSTRYIADYFFACSLKAGEDRFGQKIVNDSSRFSILKNGIDTKRFQYDWTVREKMRNTLGIQDKKVIGHVGRFAGQKNHAFLVDIFKEIYTKDSSYVLLMIGDGPLKKAVEDRIHSLGLEDHVILLKAVSDIEKYYQAMDYFVFPSLFEGLGIVTIEAQCSGLRCLISDGVSKECIITDDQVEVMPLSLDAQAWAKKILNTIDYIRKDRSEDVKKKGYDITDTTEMIQRFYLNVYGGGHYG